MNATNSSVQKLVFETSQHHLCRHVPIASPRTSAGEIRRQLETRRFDTVSEIAVCDDDMLLGLINIEDLLPAPPGALASALMDPKPPVVLPGTDQEVAAWRAVKHFPLGRTESLPLRCLVSLCCLFDCDSNRHADALVLLSAWT